MQPLPPALIAGMCPPDVEKRFYDDRLEAIPYDEPTDVVAISVETYTARRSVSDRQRVSGDAASGRDGRISRHSVHRTKWPLRRLGGGGRSGGPVRTVHRRLPARPARTGLPRKPVVRPSRDHPDRSIFHGKRYLPIRLVEFARGCRFRCDFCAIQFLFSVRRTTIGRSTRPDEIARVRRPGQMIFFIDDNLTSMAEAARS